MPLRIRSSSESRPFAIRIGSNVMAAAPHGKGMRYPGRYPPRRARSSGAGAISLFVARDFIHADRVTGATYVC